LNLWEVIGIVLLGAVALLLTPYLPHNASLLGLITGLGTALIVVGFTEYFLHRHHLRVAGHLEVLVQDLVVQDPSKPVTKTNLSYADMVYAINLLADDAKGFAPDMIIGINTGGMVTASLVAKRSNLRQKAYTLFASVGQDGGPNYVANWPDSFPVPKRILLVNDARRQGTHLRMALDYLKQRYPPPHSEIRTQVILKERGYQPFDQVPVDPDVFAYWTEKHNVSLPWDPPGIMR
jgi:hypoxanthine phosphoribosyltransferase